MQLLWMQLTIKGEDTISLEMKGISDMTDYFVVTHGNNERQVRYC